MGDARSRHGFVDRERRRVGGDLALVVCLRCEEGVIQRSVGVDGSVLTHAPVVLLRPEEAVEEDDGRSIVAEVFEAVLRLCWRLVEVVGEADAVVEFGGGVQSRVLDVDADGLGKARKGKAGEHLRLRAVAGDVALILLGF